MLVHMEASGSAEEVVPVFTEFGNQARARGYRVFVEDPPQLAKGKGRFDVELPTLNDKTEASAAVTALIDQVPGADAVLRITNG